MDKLLVSACLLGKPCRYDGKRKRCDAVCALAGRYELVPVCPECDGGLPTPRVPSERQGERVVMRDGTDVTAQYRKGAAHALAVYRNEGCVAAVLKSRSPSCGSGEIYDGSFTKTLVCRDGVTAQMLKENGIPVLGEKELSALGGAVRAQSQKKI